MLCPKCKQKLMVTGQERLETIDEHVMCVEQPSLKDVYQCINDNCQCNHYGFMWNDYGDFYSGKNFKASNKVFPDDKYAALDSHAKQSEVEIYKKGLKKAIYFHPIFCLWFLKPFIEINYKSNLMGEILKKTYHLRFLKKSEHGYGILFSPAWGTWKYLWREFKNHLKNGNLEEAFKKSFNRSWEYRWFEWFVKKLYEQQYELHKDILNGKVKKL